MLIRNSGERAARHQEKIVTVLRYLGREKWSDFDTLNRLFGFRNHRGLYDLLNKLVSTGEITKHRAGKVSLWSIIPDDLSRLSDDAVRSGLAKQNARLSLEAMGAENWRSGSEAAVTAPLSHRPSALMTVNGRHMAIEVHTRIRTRARYKELLRQHLMARGLERWHRVLFVCLTENQKHLIRMMVESVREVTMSGTTIVLETGHYDLFRYVTLNELRSAKKSL